MIKKQKKILIAILLILWLQLILIIGFVNVNGESMNNTLEDQHRYLIKDKDVNPIRRFDIVIINSKELDEKIVKRVVGLPGETVKYKDNNLYINGELIEQDFDSIQDTSINEYEITLKEDEYYVLGDNRPNSTDSRIIGPVTYDEIESILVLE